MSPTSTTTPETANPTTPGTSSRSPAPPHQTPAKSPMRASRGWPARRSPWTSRARLPEWRRDARFARAEAGVSARTTHARAGRPYRSSGTRLALWLVAGRKHSCVAACRPQERSAQSHADVARGCVRGLGSRFLEGVGDRVLEAQRAAFARGGIPCVGPAPCAGGLEERRVEPGLDRILGLGRSGVRQRRRRVLRRACRRRPPRRRRPGRGGLRTPRAGRPFRGRA